MKSAESLLGYLLGGLLFLLPVFFLPITGDFFEFNKLALLAGGALVGLFLWGLSQTKEDFKIRITPHLLPLMVFGFVVLISAFVVTPNKMDAFLFPGTATLIAAATIFYFLITQYSNEEKQKDFLVSFFLAGVAVAGLVAAFSAIGGWGIVSRFAAIPAWVNQPTFNTTGGILPAITLFAAVLPLAVGRLVKRISKLAAGAVTENVKREGSFVLNSIFLILIAAGIVATAFQALPGKPAFPRTLPLETGWSIALETLKRFPILGVGPGNFVEAFNRFRPVEYNFTDVWNIRFGASSNWYLHIFTTSGILGITALVWVLWTVWKKLDLKKLSPIHYSLFTTLVLFLLVPANLLLIVTFYFLLALVAMPLTSELAFKFTAYNRDHGVQGKGNILGWFTTLLALAGTVGLLFFGGKVYAGEVAYRKALNAVVANNGGEAYNNMIQAIRNNPQITRYRVDNSQINLAIANNIASKQDLSDKERQTVSQLVQQSIAEGKAAVALSQNRAELWENLARIYQTLIPAAQGADQFAIATYQQAIALDPINPNLRIALGGVFYGLGRYDDAIKVFELAVAAKPNHANARYNLASALREKKDTARAVAEMEQVLQLVDINSPDYQTAQTELDKLRGKLKEEQEATKSAQPGTTLTPPGQQTGTEIEPPLQLPAESAPPATDSGSPGQ